MAVNLPPTSLQYSVKMSECRVGTAPGHLQSNGQAQRHVDTVRTAITKGLSDCKTLKSTNAFLIKYRTTVHSVTGRTPFEVLRNRMLRTSLDVIKPGMVGQVNRRVKQDTILANMPKTGSLFPIKTCWRKIFWSN